MLSQLLFSLSDGAHAAPFDFTSARQLARLPHAAIVVGSHKGVEARARVTAQKSRPDTATIQDLTPQYLTPQRTPQRFNT
jgi:hypothetical protein